VVIAGRAYDWACVSRLYTGDGSGCIVEATGCALLRRAKVGWIGTYRLGRYVSSFMGTGVPTIGPSSISTTLPSATLCGNVLDAPCRSCLSVVFGYDCPPEARHSVRLLPRCGASRLVEAEIEILQLTVCPHDASFPIVFSDPVRCVQCRCEVCSRFEKAGEGVPQASISSRHRLIELGPHSLYFACS